MYTIGCGPLLKQAIWLVAVAVKQTTRRAVWLVEILQRLTWLVAQKVGAFWPSVKTEW